MTKKDWNVEFICMKSKKKAFELIRQVKSEETFVPCKSRGEMLIGRDADVYKRQDGRTAF